MGLFRLHSRRGRYCSRAGRLEASALVAMVAKKGLVMTQEVFCKACGSENTDVIESRICKNGTRRRRYRCLSCSYRWTHWNGPRPARGQVAGSRVTRSRLWIEKGQVKYILLAPLEVTNAQIARKIGFSPEWVRKIRTGLVHTNIHPELERRKPSPSSASGRSCYNCFHWSPGCDFGFPDPCAQDCDLFKLKTS